MDITRDTDRDTRPALAAATKEHTMPTIDHTRARHQDDRRARTAMTAERTVTGLVVRTPYIDGTRALMVRASDQYADRVARRIDPTAVLSHRFTDNRTAWAGVAHVYQIGA